MGEVHIMQFSHYILREYSPTVMHGWQLWHLTWDFDVKDFRLDLNDLRTDLRLAHNDLGLDLKDLGHTLDLTLETCILISHLGQLSLQPTAGWKMSTGQGAMILSRWGVKAGMTHLPVDQVHGGIGGRQDCDPSLKGAMCEGHRDEYHV